MIRLYSDDFGYSAKADRGIIRLIRRGKLFGVSILSTMVSSASIRQLKRTLQKKSNLILGVHINLIEGKPILNYIKIKSLLNGEGEFFPLVLFILKLLFKRVDKAQVKSEIESQLTLLKSQGLRVKALDSHQHTHALSPVAEIVVDASSKYGIPYIRSFNSIKTYSLKARITYALLKVLAFISYFATYKKIGLPATWRLKQKFDWTVMSWEGKALDVRSIKKNRSAFVIHPYLPYDSNKSYLRFIK